VKRKNHSYVVRYYAPAGTDATVYPGSVDMSFVNDSPGALLIQTYEQHDRAYFIYYGTRDDRLTQIYGPFILGTTPPPPDKEEITTDLPPGERKKLNERISGMKVMWYRSVTMQGKENVESFFSNYEARSLFYAVGARSLAEIPPPSLKASSSSSSLPKVLSPSMRHRTIVRPSRRR
jgi:hypothetical protein